MKWQSYAHPISDVRDWNRSKRLQLRPDFQRREVWSRAGQIMLIDTILNDIPIPKIYIQSIIQDGHTYRIVVDGQQRLTAILKFLDDQLSLGKPYNGEYKGMKFSQLPSDVQNSILRYKIDINEIFNPTEEEIRDLYARVNKYTVQLNKQELRKADFYGDFIKVAEILSELPFFVASKIFTIKMRRRMLDVEYVEELLALMIEGIQDKKVYIDDICEKYMVLGDQMQTIISNFTQIIEDIERIFDDSFKIQDTRFKQKSDFYSIFGCIAGLIKDGLTIIPEKLPNLRKELNVIDKKVAPHSEEEVYREYAMRCLSDANSINSRKWRQEYLLDFIQSAYGKCEG
jgi:hypothetical protein